MPTAKAHAFAILAKFEQAQTDLVGKCVILADGKAGTVEKVWLDECMACAFLSQDMKVSGRSRP
jgi:hypothetical protein